MTDDRRQLERRYRRWVALYPQSFRADHEDEMIAVLMQGARPDQTRPRPAEAVNLAAHGLGRRVTSPRFPSNWERAHANIMFPVRILIALWLCFISAVLIGDHRGEPWLLLTVPALLLHLYIAYRIRPSTTSR